LDFVWVKALLRGIVLPPAGPLFVAITGLAAVRRYPRTGRALIVIGIVSLFVLSVPAVAWLLEKSVEVAGPVVLEDARKAQAIVIPGGGVRRDALEYGGETLAGLTLERVRYGARLARETNLPVLVSGGAVFGGTPEAVLMRNVLEGEFAQPVKWVEVASRTTRENAQRSAELLRASGVTRIVLIAHGFDIRRAAAEYRAAGLSVVPAPTGLAPGPPDSVLDYLPSMAGLRGSYYALYEILANTVRALEP
jgi:uncharacterized SAM-binding protein YcdF (DUF218 family)